MMVTDRRRYPGDEGTACERLAEAAGLAARAGVDYIQIRERGLDDRRLLALVERVKQAVAATQAGVIVNDRIDVAMAARADGVHLPARAVSGDAVRRIVPQGFLIGRSTHAADEVVRAEQAGGCDYLMFGSVYESASKPAGHRVSGLEALARACAATHLPVVAIGGITADRARDVALAGAAGIAAIGLFAAADEAALARTVGELRQAFLSS
jgi:thiamine-phosphate pyrophosphorylase